MRQATEDTTSPKNGLKEKMLEGDDLSSSPSTWRLTTICRTVQCRCAHVVQGGHRCRGDDLCEHLHPGHEENDIEARTLILPVKVSAAGFPVEAGGVSEAVNGFGTGLPEGRRIRSGHPPSSVRTGQDSFGGDPYPSPDRIRRRIGRMR